VRSARPARELTRTSHEECRDERGQRYVGPRIVIRGGGAVRHQIAASSASASGPRRDRGLNSDERQNISLLAVAAASIAAATAVAAADSATPPLGARMLTPFARVGARQIARHRQRIRRSFRLRRRRRCPRLGQPPRRQRLSRVNPDTTVSTAAGTCVLP
jgi:hypothetical protein